MSQISRRALVVLVILVPLALPADASPQVREVSIALGGLPDAARLEAYDPRAPDIAGEPIDGVSLWTGTLATSGGLVRLVEGPGWGVALVEVAPGLLRWATLEGDTLVPLVLDAEDVVDVDTELEVPEGLASTAAVSSPRDGKLQLFVDADSTFTNAHRQYTSTMQLMIVSLVDAIFRVSLDVEVEVVGLHGWTEAGPLTGPIRCSGGSDDLLRQFRDHYEATDPTLSALREESIIFTRNGPVAHPEGGTLLGCGYIRQLETPWAYSSALITGNLGDQGTDLAPNVLLTAHEMGHNFYGLHERALPTPYGPGGCVGGTVMYPYLCANTPVFSGARGASFHVPNLMEDGGNAPWMQAYARSRI